MALEPFQNHTSLNLGTQRMLLVELLGEWNEVLVVNFQEHNKTYLYIENRYYFSLNKSTLTAILTQLMNASMSSQRIAYFKLIKYAIICSAFGSFWNRGLVFNKVPSQKSPI